jgi:hypothetical protein
MSFPKYLFEQTGNMAPKTDSQAAKTDAKSVKAGPLVANPAGCAGMRSESS